MTPAVIVDDALDGPALDAMRDAVLSSKLLGDSTLAGTFEATRGFSVTFRRSALFRVTSRFPHLAPFLALALDDDRTALVQRRPWLGRPPAPNACYLNVLVVPAGAAVGRHVDATLGPPNGTVVPQAVSVLYLDVAPDIQGGALALYDDDREVQTIAPRVGRYVVFAGALGHEVRSVQASRPRVSIVCEQYALSPGVLSAVPEMRVQSRGFARVLASLRR